MGLLERGLAKLKLEAYTSEGQVSKLGSIKAMYNPESVYLDYEAKYGDAAGVNQHEEVSWYQRVAVPTLTLDLILDARGPRGGSPVDEQLSDLRAMCFTVGSKAEAPYLRVTWGKMSWHGHGYFDARAVSLSVAYTLFDRNASPLRATAKLVLRAKTSDEMAKFKALKESPQMEEVKDKMSLPQTVPDGGQSEYLELAAQNDLNHLSDLKPGDTLVYTKK
ncbi:MULTISPECIES: hypothetical protein [unclassified Burkholderia]|uniref:CIS tube protein n=1 Tax=unclassified Burkholderia TaxID=2613784 RepID=UPI000759A4A0|nr:MULTISPECIES: hypothetical protein [unclassified Burkholderia]KVN20656.1 hypothetical protein WT08_28115 [Burkholderia sp. MSMB1552]KWZ46940.1 hypothetical protein WS92_29815 [Burkholderia sp. MSMB1588]